MFTNHVSPPSTLPPGSIVDTYLRDSGGEKQDRSVARQLEAIQQYCAQHKLQLRHVYKDVAKSGGSTAGRDAFDRMISSTRNETDRPHGILLWNYARFARDLDDSTYYKALLRSKRGIIIHSLTDPIPEGPYGRFVEILIDISNEEKRRQTSIDSKDGIRSIVAQGAVPGVPPRGIKRIPIITINPRTGEERKNHRWVPDPKFKARIYKAFAMRARGASLWEIQQATHLFSSINSYATFWRNKIYMGTLEYGGMVFENYCEAIVPPQVWEKVQIVQAKFAQKAHVKSGDASHPRRLASNFLLSGIARCARCGAPLYGHTSHQKQFTYQSYFCTLAYRKRGECVKSRIPRPAFEQAVINTLTEAILKKEYLEEMHSLLVHRQSDLRAQTEEKIREKNVELGEIKRQLTNLGESLSKRPSSETLLTQLDSLELQKRDIESQIQDLKNATDDGIIEAQLAIKTEAFDRRLNKIIEILKGKDEQAKKSLLRGLIPYVDVEREDDVLRGTIYFFLPIDDDLPPEETPPDPGGDGPDYVPKVRKPSGPPIRRHIMTYSFVASTNTRKRPR